MKFSTAHNGLLALSSIFIAGSLQAGVILQPSGAVTTSVDGGATEPMGHLTGFEPTRAIDQSGLNVGYTSLVTDFDSYIASNPTHGSNLENYYWLSDPAEDAPVTGFFDFDLGAEYTIESFALWNFGGNGPQNVLAFDLIVANNPAFTGGTGILVDPVNINTGPSNAVLAQVFEFDTPTVGRYVRMEILSNNGHSDFVSFGEAAFEVVPEPSTTSVLGVAAMGLLFRRHRSSNPTK